MRKGLILALGIFIILASVILLTSTTFAVGEATTCCEKTLDNAWCQNSPPAECNTNYRTAQTSCEATSYCKLGTCIDSNEGTCLENTPLQVCQDNEGYWIDAEPEEISQCTLGCCILGDQAAFVTQSRCEVLSAQVGLQTNYRRDITDEISCIASASPRVMGACVIDDQLRRGCRMLTKEECNNLRATQRDATIEFHEGFLCSAESLGTVCGDSSQTTCVEDRYEVYYVDTCGNVANVYDASKRNDKDYWTKIYEPDESCSLDQSLSNAASCGNCDYLGDPGTICKAYSRGDSQTPTKPRFGDYVCADLSCKYEGEPYQHGESWCVTNVKDEDLENTPGSEYYRLLCQHGEVITEACSPEAPRAKVCLEGETDGFRYGWCVFNRWQDCALQENQEDCEDLEYRDCQWVEGASILKDEKGGLLTLNSDGDLVQGGGEGQAACVPLYAPGFKFWEEDSEAEELCLVASADCIVKYVKKFRIQKDVFTWECEENCHCLGDDWEEKRNEICMLLGDCGSSVNYIGELGEEKESISKERI